VKVKVQTNIPYLTDYYEKVKRSLPNNIKLTVSNPTPYAAAVELGHVARDGTWVEGRFMMTNTLDQVPEMLRFQYAKAMRETSPMQWSQALTNASRHVSYSTKLKLEGATPKLSGLLASQWKVNVRRET
jgi:hypothetical protein